MGTQAQPQPETPQTPPNQSSSTPQTGSEAAPTNGEELRAALASLNAGALNNLHEQLAAERAKTQLLEQQLNQRKTSEAPRPTGADFLNDPVPVIQDVVRKDMQAAVAPLVDFVQKVQKRDAYVELKAAAKAANPTLAAKLSEVEPIVDQLMANVEPTPQNFQAVFVQALGMQALQGATKSAASTPTPNLSAPNMPNNPVPPNMPPSPPSVPRMPNSTPDSLLKQKVEALTEDERRIARIFNMTPEQYIQYREAQPEVATWQEIK